MSSFWTAPVADVGGTLTEAQMREAIDGMMRPPSPPMIITTRAEKQKALDWRDARAAELVSRGMGYDEAFVQADREAIGRFVGPYFRAAKEDE